MDGMKVIGLEFGDVKMDEEDISKALKEIPNSDTLAEAMANLDMGQRYYNGIGFPKNLELSFKFYKMAADQGNKIGQYYLASLIHDHFLHRKNNVQQLKNIKNPKEVFKKYLTASAEGEMGYPAAKHWLGRCYFQGELEHPKAKELAFRYFWESKEAVPDSHFYLGRCYEEGFGIAKNPENAFKAYKAAAKAGSFEACNALGVCYKEGIGVKKDLTLAIHFLNHALKSGVEGASIILAKIYLHEKEKFDQPKAMEILEKAAKNNFLPANEFLAILWFQGELIPKDESKAVKYLKKSVELGSNRGLFTLGRCYLYGRGTEVDLEKGHEYLQKALNKGCKEAMEEKADCYLKGLGVPKNVKSAIVLLKIAEKKGSVYALRRLGECYFTEIGLKKDLKLAYKYFSLGAEKEDGFCQYYLKKVLEEELDIIRKAANQKSAYHQNALAISYIAGFLVKQDLEMAHTLLKAASEKHLLDAKNNLAWFYILNGDEKEVETGVKLLYSLAVEYSKQGNLKNNEPGFRVNYKTYLPLPNTPYANYFKGLCYQNEITVEKDLKRAFSLFKQASLESREAKIALAQCYLYGIGTEKNPKLGFKKLQSLSLTRENKYDFQVMCYLGECALYGMGVPKNVELGLAAFEFVAEQGYYPAYFYLGWCYEAGLGVTKSRKQAFEYYQLAAEKGDFPKAQLYLGWFFEQGIQTEPDYKTAFEWYKKAMQGLDREAINNVGTFYEQGLVAEQNAQKAFELYYFASKLGHATAEYNLGRCHEYGIGTPKNRFLAEACYKSSLEKGYSGETTTLTLNKGSKL